jgi:hypothetical protein
MGIKNVGKKSRDIKRQLHWLVNNITASNEVVPFFTKIN